MDFLFLFVPGRANGFYSCHFLGELSLDAGDRDQFWF